MSRTTLSAPRVVDSKGQVVGGDLQRFIDRLTEVVNGISASVVGDLSSLPMRWTSGRADPTAGGVPGAVGDFYLRVSADGASAALYLMTAPSTWTAL